MLLYASHSFVATFELFDEFLVLCELGDNFVKIGGLLIAFSFIELFSHSQGYCCSPKNISCLLVLLSVFI